MARSILNGVTFVVVIRSCSIPLSNIATASLIFAVQIPTAPASNWSLAIAGHLCVLACGRLAIPLRDTVRSIVAKLASSASRSTHSDGVSSSHLDIPICGASWLSVGAISTPEYPFTEVGTNTLAAPAVCMKRRRETVKLVICSLHV